MEKVEIKETKNYDMFKQHDSNRKIDDLALKKLVASIQVENLLEFRPILIDSKMRIIDGQHRLEAARQMKIPVFYQLKKDLKSNDMVLLNSNQKNWTNLDYVNFYSSEGKEEYVKLKTYMITKKYKLVFCLNILHGHRSHELGSKIRSGTYKFPTDVQIKEVEQMIGNTKKIIDYIKEKQPSSKFVVVSMIFLSALVEFLNNKGVVFDDFFKKVQYKLDLLRPCSRKVDYVLIFKEMYNWKNRNPLEEIST